MPIDLTSKIAMIKKRREMEEAMEASREKEMLEEASKFEEAEVETPEISDAEIEAAVNLTSRTPKSAVKDPSEPVEDPSGCEQGKCSCGDVKELREALDALLAQTIEGFDVVARRLDLISDALETLGVIPSEKKTKKTKKGSKK